MRNHPPALTILTLSVLLAISACGSAQEAGLNSGDPRVVWSDTPVAMGLLGNNVSLSLTLAATILPPTVSGTTLDADDVFVSGLNTYVSYNIPGATHMGGIDQINMTVPLLPVRTASTTFNTSTINGVYVNGSTVYSVGATTGSTPTGYPAVLYTQTVGHGSFSTVASTAGLQNTYAGTAVTLWNNYLFALSGSTGGLTLLDPNTLSQISYTAISDARAASFYGTTSDLFVVAGGGNVYDINSSGTIVHTISLTGNTIPESKSTIQVGKTMVLVSLGDGGAAVVCQADQKTLATIAAPVINGISSTLTVTNAVSAGPGLLFAADGQAGVYVYSMTYGSSTTSSCNSVSLSLLGNISVGSNYSANNVKYVNGNLYVATGGGGFQVMVSTLAIPIVNALLDFI